MKTLLAAVAVLCAFTGQALPKAFYSGNFTANFKKAFAGIYEDAGSSKQFTVPEAGKFNLVIWAQMGKYRNSKPDIEKLLAFIRNGGIVMMHSAVPAAVFRGKNISDLTPGTAVLGASAYVYAKTKESASEAARKIFGDKTDRYNIYPAMTGKHPGLGKATNMVRLFGSKNFIELGVHRIGKGALVYTSADPRNPDYAEALVQLSRILSDPVRLEQCFPAPKSNAAAEIDARRVHLSVAEGGEGPAKSFFTRMIGKITGKSNLGILDNNPEQLVFHIGRTPYVESLKLDFDRLHPFGYYMVCRDGKNVVLAGKSRKATMFAVNDFLKRYAGYRKFGNGEIFEVIPSGEFIKIPEKFEIREEPAINSYYLANSPNEDFGRNSRVNCRATHALAKLVPVKKYAKSHPEYFPLINGVRKKMNPSKNGPWNPCISHPDMPRLVAEYADQYFKQNPDRLGLPLGVNDGGGDCQCEKCAAEFRNTGNQYARFYNMAARVLAKSHPDKVVSFIAYSRTGSKVPRGVRMEPNILVEITGLRRSAFVEMPKWKAAGIQSFGLYDYLYTVGADYITPRYYPRVMGKIWRETKRNYNIQTIWAEYYPRSVLFESPRQYVLDELAWNPKVDIEALLDDYFKSMYGEAAMPVKRFFDIFEEVYARKPYADCPSYDWRKPLQLEEYTFRDLERLDRELAAAQKAAKTPMVRRRVNALGKLYHVLKLNIENYLCARELRKIRKIDSESAVQRVLALIDRGYAAIGAINSATMTKQEEQDIFVNPKKFGLAGLKKMSKLNPQILLERAVDPALDLVSAWLDREKRDLPAFYAKAAERTKFPAARAALLSQSYVCEHKPVNLVRNPSFEETVDQAESRLQTDHKPFNGVRDWSTWVFPNSTTRFFIQRKNVRDGKNAAAIGELQIGGALISYVKLEPNCRYRLSFFVRRNRGDEGFGLGAASVRMRGKSGWLDKGSAIKIHYPPECGNDWTKVGTTFSAPDESAIALILLGAPCQADGVWTAFDDVRLEKIYDPKDKKKIKHVRFITPKPEVKTPQLDTALKTADGMLGQCEAFLPDLTVELKWEKIGDDGAFKVAFHAPDRLILSGDDEGLRCGIYALLNELGIHWFSPAEKPFFPSGMVAPDWKKFVGRHIPDFSYRGLHICAGRHHFDDTVGRWMSFNGMNRKLTGLSEINVVGERLRELGLKPDTTVHAYGLLISDRKYFSGHPEFFALVGGRRIRHSEGGQLCLSNPKMRECFAEELVGQIRSNPHIGVYGFCPNDGYGHCECEACLALDTPVDRKKKLVNGRIANFVSDICRRVERKTPRVMLGHYSYSNFADFIDLLPEPPKNLLISCTMFHCYNHGLFDSACAFNAPHGKRLKQIRSKVKHVYIYDYLAYRMGRLPAPFQAALHEDFRSFRDLKIDGWLSECSGAKHPSWAAQWMNFYIAAKLLRNASIDRKSLLRNICLARYGKAALPMERFWNALQEAALSGRACMTKKPEDFGKFFTPELRTLCSKFLDEALRAEPDNPALKSERSLFTFWLENVTEREKYRTPASVASGPFSPDAPCLPIFLVERSTQLPDRKNDTKLWIFDEADHVRFRIMAHESNPGKIRLRPKKVFGGDCIELFLDDGADPRKCYHFILYRQLTQLAYKTLSA